ncbi:MAG: hypothetical protein WD021_05560 [Rhodothermales bacterium]
MSSNRNREQRINVLREALDVYLSGRSGIRFDALMRFAGPLFDLYDVDWRADDRTDALSRDRDELATMVAVLDTARLLWAFMELGDEEHLSLLPKLEDALLGPGAGDEERSNLLVLLSLLEEHWTSFSPDERRAALETPGYALPTFDMLLDEYQGRQPLPSRHRVTYGPDDLELPEALATFARPLLDDPTIADQPNLVEDRIERAQAYWDLATSDEADFDHQLQRILETFADSEREQASIRKEAHRMVARFHQLFPTGQPDT